MSTKSEAHLTLKKGPDTKRLEKYKHKTMRLECKVNMNPPCLYNTYRHFYFSHFFNFNNLYSVYIIFGK